MACTLLHAADIHLGYAQYGLQARQHDFYQAFGAMANDAIARQVQVVLLAGDLFHTRTVDANTLYQAVSVLERLRDAGIRVIAIEGNHERPHFREPLSWLAFLAQMDLLVLLAPEYHAGKMVILPWDAQEHRGAYIDLPHDLRIVGCRYVGAATPTVLADLAELVPTVPQAQSRHTILMLHAGMEGVLDAYGGTLREGDLVPLRESIQYVALGHIHKPYERLDWIYNPGSLEATSATEAQWNDRGYYVVEMTSDEGIRIPPAKVVVRGRPFVRLACHVDDIQRPTAMSQRVQELAQAAALELDDPRKPVVELTLRGQLVFSRGALDLDRMENILAETFEPLVVRIRDLSTTEPNKIDIGTIQSRRELAHHVLCEMVAQDAHLEPLSKPLAELAWNVHELALESSDPQRAIQTLESWQKEHGRPFAKTAQAFPSDTS